MKKILFSALVFLALAACSGEKPNPQVEMVRIKAGTFVMGHEGVTDAEPAHQVTITNDFYMSKFPITVGEFRKFVNDTGYRTQAERGSGGRVFIELAEHSKLNASWDNPYFEQNENHPVVLVSWNDAIAYCNWLSKVNNLTPVYAIRRGNVIPNWSANGYRLPTEAEWEFACRAGSSALFSTGDAIGPEDAWFRVNSNYGTNEVGLKPPNAWGLHDMHGNVWEWVWDWRESYTAEAKVDPSGPLSRPNPPLKERGPHRATRGGSWINRAWRLNSAERSYGTQNYRTNLLGFRVVRSYQP
jgi:formylglycine-generating enzyme required for sulfatase activity